MPGETAKTMQEAYWGALSRLPMMDAIISACIDLAAEDHPINRDTVRERSGVTSNNVLAAGLKLYHARKALTDEFAQTPAVLLHTVAQALENTFAEVETQYAAKAEAFEASAQALLAAARSDLKALGEEAKALRYALEEKEALIEAMIEQKAECDDAQSAQAAQYAALEKQYSDLLSEQRQLSSKLQDEQAERQRLQHDYRATIEDLKSTNREQLRAIGEQQQKEVDRLMTQWGNERGRWQAAEQRLNKQCSNLSTELDKAKDAQRTLTMAQAKDQQRIADLEERLALSQAQCNEHASKLEASTQANHALEKTVGDLKQALQAKEAMIAALPDASMWHQIVDALGSAVESEK